MKWCVVIFGWATAPLSVGEVSEAEKHQQRRIKVALYQFVRAMQQACIEPVQR
jgi:hypothetical protein